MTDEIELVDVGELEQPIELKKQKKRSKWTLESARAFLSKNGHAVGNKEVRLSNNAGIGAFGCADYLKNYHGFSIFNPEIK